MLSRRYLLLSVFLTGWSVLAVEMAAARLLGAFFGTGNLVWATIIGFILVYLTLGYFLGGHAADRRPTPGLWCALLLTAGESVALVAWAFHPLMRRAGAFLDPTAGARLAALFAAAILLLLLPVTLLGMVAPLALRLVLRTREEAGRTSGLLYAVSTLGSLLGTFTTTLGLIPLLGVRRTLVLHAAVLVLLGLEGLRQCCGLRRALAWGWLLLPPAGLWVWFGNVPLKPTAGLLYAAESAYNYIYVVERNGYRILYLNEGLGQHSVYHPQQLAFDGPWMHFLAGPFLNPPPFSRDDVARMAIIGLAGGTAARQAAQAFPGVVIDGFEIDPQVVEVGRRYFALDQVPNLRVWAVDGRFGIRQRPGPYDLIIVDAFRVPDIPWHLTTVEFFRLLRARLAPQGVVAVNVGRLPGDRRLVNSLATTMAQVFPVVYGMDIPGSLNSVLYAAVDPQASQAHLPVQAARLERGGAPTFLVRAVTNAAAFPAALAPGPVLTDEGLTGEDVTNGLVLSFLRQMLRGQRPLSADR